jgi:Tfp pilus assembly protein PilO
MLTDKLIKSSPSSKIFISVSTIAIVTLATYSWVVSPQIGYLHAAQQYKVIARSTAQKAKSIEGHIQKRKAELAGLHQEIDGIRGSFFTPAKAKGFFSDLDLTALQYDCNIGSLTFRSAGTVAAYEGREYFPSVTLKRAEITLTGQYDGIIKFLEKLSSYQERISVGSLLIKVSPNNAEELICSMTVTIYLIEDKETISNE